MSILSSYPCIRRMPANFGTAILPGKVRCYSSLGQETSFRKDLLDEVVQKLGSEARIHWIEGGNHSLDP